MLKYLTFTCFLICYSSVINAQQYIDLVQFDYATGTASSFDSSNVSTTLNEMNQSLTLPVVLNDSATFLTGLNYEFTSVSFQPNRERESLTGITIKLGANIKHNSKWSGTYMLLPKVSSDLKKIGKQDFQLGGVVLMKLTKTQRLNYRFGLYANGELFGPFFVPIFGFYHLSQTKKFEVNALLPLKFDCNYTFIKNNRIGLHFNGQVRTYNINSPYNSESHRYIERSTKDLYAYYQYSLNNGVNIQLSFGRSIGRTYQAYSKKIDFGLPLLDFGDNRTQLNTDFTDSWLFKIALFYRLNLEGKGK